MNPTIQWWVYPDEAASGPEFDRLMAERGKCRGSVSVYRLRSRDGVRWYIATLTFNRRDRRKLGGLVVIGRPVVEPEPGMDDALLARHAKVYGDVRAGDTPARAHRHYGSEGAELDRVGGMHPRGSVTEEEL